AAQSAARPHVRAPEARSGTPRFERSSSGAAPPAQCLALADFARRTIAESELLADSFGAYSSAVETVSIVTSTGLGQTVVADAINDVMRTTERVQVRIIDRGSIEALQVLRNRPADRCVNFSASGLAVTSMPGVRAVDQAEALTYAILDADHPLADRSSLHIRDMVDYPVGTLPAGNTARMHIEQAVRAQGRVFSPTLEATCPVLMLRALAGSSMIAMMAGRSIPSTLAEEGCIAVP